MIWWKDGQAMYMQSMESFKTGTCHTTHTCNQYSLSLDSLLNFVPRFWVCGYKDTCIILWSLLFYILWKENVFNNQNIVLVLMSSSLPYSDVDNRVLFFLAFRHVMATRLGFKSYVDLVLERTMAGSMDNIVSILDMWVANIHVVLVSLLMIIFYETKHWN